MKKATHISCKKYTIQSMTMNKKATKLQYKLHNGSNNYEILDLFD